MKQNLKGCKIKACMYVKEKCVKYLFIKENYDKNKTNWNEPNEM